jgi:hypothetical protein
MAPKREYSNAIGGHPGKVDLTKDELRDPQATSELGGRNLGSRLQQALVHFSV